MCAPTSMCIPPNPCTTDDDECATAGACAANATCKNTVGGYSCTCPPGSSSPNPKTVACMPSGALRRAALLLASHPLHRAPTIAGARLIIFSPLPFLAIQTQCAALAPGARSALRVLSAAGPAVETRRTPRRHAPSATRGSPLWRRAPRLTATAQVAGGPLILRPIQAQHAVLCTSLASMQLPTAHPLHVSVCSFAAVAAAVAASIPPNKRSVSSGLRGRNLLKVQAGLLVRRQKLDRQHAPQVHCLCCRWGRLVAWSGDRVSSDHRRDMYGPS